MATGVVDLSAYLTEARSDNASQLNGALAAISASGGGVALAPNGDFGFTSETIQVPANVHLIGTGDTAFYVSGTPSLANTAVALTGDRAKCSGIKVYVTGGDYRRCLAYRASNTTFEDMYVNHTSSATAAAAYGVYYAATSTLTNIAMRRIEVTSSGAGNIFGGVLGTDVVGLVAEDIWVHDIVNSYNTKLNWGAYFSDTSYQARIRNIRVTDCNSSGIHLAGDIAESEYGRVVMGCLAQNCDFNGFGIDNLQGVAFIGNTSRQCDLLWYVNSGTKALTFIGNVIDEMVDGPGGPIDSDRCLVSIDGQGHFWGGNVIKNRGTANRGIKVDGSNHTFMPDSWNDKRPRNAYYFKTTSSECEVYPGAGIAGTDDSSTAVTVIEVYGARNKVRGGRVTVQNGCYGARIGGTGDVDVYGTEFYGLATASRGVWVNGTNNTVDAVKVTGACTTPIHQSGNTGSRIRVEETPSGLGRNWGTSTQDGTGVATAFTISHGLYTTPTSWSVTAGSSAARGDFYVTASSTQLTVTFAVAPVLGTGNVVLVWEARV